MLYALTARSTHPNRLPLAHVPETARSHRALERFLSQSLSAAAGAPTAANIDDGEKSYTLQLDMPGLARDQIDVTIEADVVRVSSKADAPRSVKAAWRFPLEIDVEATSAKLENGVLTLTLGKKLPVNVVKTIEVH